MTSKQVVMDVLNGKQSERIPVTPHWWGLYKFQLSGLIEGYENERLAWGQNAEQLFETDKAFYNRFRPDLFHLTTAPNLYSDPKKEQEILRVRKEVAALDSKSRIDEYMKLVTRSEEDVLQGGEFRHVELCAKEFGEDVFIAVNEGSDTAAFFDSHVGFEDGLIGLLDNPENVAYFLEQLYDNTFERMKALQKSGAHGYINSETYCSSDIMSPLLYRDIFLPVQKRFYKRVKELGLIPIAYFTGDIDKILEYIKELDIMGLMVEESKKTFVIDVGELTARLEGKIACFGNLDSHYILEKGTVEEVERETKRQVAATKGRPFIMANGCPVSFHTPPQNIDCMIQTTRNRA